MSDLLIEYQLRLRNADDDGNTLTVTSVSGGTNPYISKVPTGDGTSIDVFTGRVTSGVFTITIVDPITSGTDRLFTSLLEDANGKAQLGQRKAFLEFREDGGAWEVLHAGRISRCSLASEIEWEIAIGDWMQAEHEATIFDTPDTTTIADFLTAWPRRGCLYGGPVRQGFLTEPDIPGWTMRVRKITTAGDNVRYRLEPVTIYGPSQDPTQFAWQVGGKLKQFAGFINQAVQSLPNGVFNFGTFGGLTTVGDAASQDMEWGGLIVLVGPDDAPVAFRPIPPHSAGFVYGGLQSFDELVNTHTGQDGAFIYLDNQEALIDGSLVQVRCLTILPTELCPIYWQGHPVDLLALLWTEAHIPYDATALETVRDALGATREIAVRITGPIQLGSFLESLIYGPLGVGTRMNSDGEVEAFSSRIIVNTLPAVTITDADVDQDSVQTYDFDATTAVRRFVLEHTQFVPKSNQFVDGIATQQERFELENGDPGSIGTGEVSYQIPGMLRWSGVTNQSLLAWTASRAAEVFERTGRGPITAEMLLLRSGSGADVVLGDEILVDLPQMPRANKRMGDAAVSARAMQVVHVTPTLRGKQVRLLDSGPNAQPIATAPTLTIAASSDYPRNVAEVTITNAATLNTSLYAVRIQMATTGSALTDYSDVLYFSAGNVPTTAIQLPAIVADTTIYVRGRTEDATERPSDWSTGVSVALDPFTAPSALTATPSTTDGSQCDLAWTVGESTAYTEVYLEWHNGSDDDWIPGLYGLGLQQAEAAALVEVLDPGSNVYTLEDLDDASGYIASVNHLDPATGDRSASDTQQFSTVDDIVTLASPSSPDGFSFGRATDPLFQRVHAQPSSAGLYGIGVVATEGEAAVEIAEAVEATVGGGSYGEFATVGRLLSVADGWTVWSAVAANDGLRRKLKARHVRDGYTSSAYCDTVTITPWTYNPLIAVPGTLSLAMRFTETTGADDTHYYGEIAVTDSSPQGDDTVTLMTVDATSTSVLLSPSTLFAGLGTGTPTALFATTDTVAVEFLRPSSGAGASTANFVALASNRAVAELAVTVPVQSAVPPVVSSVAIGVDTYTPSVITVTKTISGDYDHFRITITGDTGTPYVGANGQVTFNVTTLLGYNLLAVGGTQTHTLDALVEAMDGDDIVQDSDSSGAQLYNADPDT